MPFLLQGPLQPTACCPRLPGMLRLRVCLRFLNRASLNQRRKGSTLAWQTRRRGPNSCCGFRSRDPHVGEADSAVPVAFLPLCMDALK